MYYVYRFKDVHEQIIYVGKTKSLKSRMSQHFSSSGHLGKEVYDKVIRVEYIEVSSKIEMDIKELYYIDKWKPVHNTIHVHENEVSNVSLEEDIDWLVHFDKSNRGEILASKLREISNEKQEFDRERDKFGDTVVYMNNKIEAEKVVSSILRYEKEGMSNKIKELELLLKEKIDTKSIIDSISFKEESKDYFDFDEALLLAEFIPNYEFVVSFVGRFEKKYHIFNNGEGYTIKDLFKNTEYNTQKGRMTLIFVESVLREIDKTVLISGQSSRQVFEDIKQAQTTKKHKKEICEKYADFLSKGSAPHKIKDDFEWFFYERFGSYLSYHWNESLGDYDVLYRAGLYIEEHNIKTHRQMLELMKRDINSLSEVI